MTIINFREVGGAYAAKHALVRYYRATGQVYDPKKLAVDGKKLYVPVVPPQVLDTIVRKIEPSARIVV